jgi:hypothetical protein
LTCTQLAWLAINRGDAAAKRATAYRFRGILERGNEFGKHAARVANKPYRHTLRRTPANTRQLA